MDKWEAAMGALVGLGPTGYIAQANPTVQDLRVPSTKEEERQVSVSSSVE